MKKFVLILVCVLISYAGIYAWAIYRFPKFVYECTANPIDREMFNNPEKLNSAEKKVFLSKTYSCVSEKQTLVERFVVNTPTKW
ncbi:hypothetical protein [Sulfuriferula nivalis]|uniref:Uncharacterized protein n=1 Tax=Sulfuriferula nivalis TaxID=2675298 RepID=A0A809SE36_9PROT|nr:hypothetical protein [Sulfuriferula nivalis]BBP01087.1 hypothetical protein SFSGTM_17950 [Sulfuriferula nivalis]